MKRYLSIIILFAITINGIAQTSQSLQVKNTPVKEILVLKEPTFDFGKIPQGRPVTHDFEIINTGKEPLIIEDVRASCGCTTPEWSREAMSPGATSKIKVGYNSAAEGPFSKTVTINYNGTQIKTIIISGSVYKAPATSAPLNPSLSLLKQSNK